VMTAADPAEAVRGLLDVIRAASAHVDRR
jgi:hypothetical protein